MPEQEPIELPPAEHPLPDRPEEEKLREEIRSLREQLEQSRQKKHDAPPPESPRRRTLIILALLVLAIFAAAFALGYLPRQRREAELQQEALAEQDALPVVPFVIVKHAEPISHLLLPGTMQGLVDSPILARADGYLKKWYVDIGDRVKEGQLMAEIDAPDLDQQVRQAHAMLSQAQASLKQATANLDQGRANVSLAQVNARRWAGLLKRGAVSKEENDQYQTNFVAQTAAVVALVQAVGAAQESESAAQANLDRLLALQGYEQVRSPVNGTVTLRNIDVGALISTGTTLLYRVAQLGRLRTYIYVPQENAPMVQVRQAANLYVSEFPARAFHGVVTRTADALDPNTRTLLTEVQVDNPASLLRPGMYAQVTLNNTRSNPPALVPGQSLLVRSTGAFVAVLTDPQPAARPQPQQQALTAYTVKLAPVNLGRDFGNEIEILSGLKDGDLVVANPNDSVREGVKVKGEPLRETGVSASGNIDENTERLLPVPSPQPPPAGKQAPGKQRD